MADRRLARERATENLIQNILPRVTFTEAPNRSLMCLMCQQILKDPQQLSCGHRVCKTCNESDLSVKSEIRFCPDDGDVIDRVFPDRAALTDVMNLTCYCVAHDDGCCWSGLVLDLEDHVSQCLLCSDNPCPYQVFRCNYAGSRRKIIGHLTKDSYKHDVLLSTCLKECLNDLEANGAMINKGNEDMANLSEIIDNIRTRMLSFEASLSETSSRVSLQHIEMIELVKVYNLLQDLLSRGEIRRSQFTEFHDKYDKLLVKVNDQMRRINTFVDTDSQSNNNNNTDVNNNMTTSSLNEKLKQVETSNKTHEKMILDLGIKIRIAQCSNNNGDYTWKLDNFKVRLGEAKQGSARELYSPPLYSSQFGYKYSAKVLLCGENPDTIGFYFVLMPGDYDEILRFPFPYPVEITMINFAKKNDISHTLFPDPGKTHFQKPGKNMNPAIGFARFCTHAQLLHDGFVRNDTVYFRIHLKKLGINVNEPDI